MNEGSQGPWRQEVTDFTRAFSGAFLFGMPLLFTMEMWWIGEYAELWKLFIFLCLALGANLGLSYFAGFRQNYSIGQIVNQAIDAVAVGVLASLLVLLVLNRFQPSDPLDSVLGKIIIQSVPLSLGASAANAVFAPRPPEDENAPNQRRHNRWGDALNDLGGTIAGGIFVGFSIAPTDEIPMLAAELDYVHKLALIGLSLERVM